MRSGLWLLLITLVVALLAALGYLLYAGFTDGWPDWTGFGEYTMPTAAEKRFERGKTLWDWMQLFSVPVVLAITAFFLNRTHRLTAEKIADRRTQDAVLDTYLSQMADLLLDKHLLESQPDEAVREIARICTLTALRRLDGARNQILTEFLHDAGVLGRSTPIIDMSRANLEGARLEGANLEGANLQRADLHRANLEGANLQKAYLHSADLREVKLHRANLRGAHLQAADLRRADLHQASLRVAFLQKTDLRAASLQAADLHAAVLDGANLEGANLRKANLQQANLQETNLQEANLEAANLQGATLPIGWVLSSLRNRRV